MFSCNSLIGSDSRFGAFYRKCRDRGMPHGKALKAVAGKRLKVIYAIVRDRVPYAAWRAAGKSRIPKPLGEEGSAELSLLVTYNLLRTLTAA